MILKRITPEWERLGFFDDQQFGSRMGTSIVTPLTIATALSELAYADHVPLLAISQDISKAYDSVPIRLGVEVALRRFGLPEDFIEHYLNSHRDNRAVIATAYGASDSILGAADGTFSFTRGVPQGATESPFCWIAFYSILMAMQSDTNLVPEGCLEITGACLRQPDTARGRPLVAASKRTSGLCFVDDALWYSNTRRGVEMRLAVCSLFFEFFAVQFNVGKTKALGLEWFKGPMDIADNSWTPWVYDTQFIFETGAPAYDDNNNHIGPSAACVGEIGVVPLCRGTRYLGVQWSPANSHVDTSNGLRAIVDDFLAKVSAVPIGADSTRYLVDQVLFPKLQFKLRFERFDETTVDQLQRDVTTLLLERAKLNQRINRRVLQAPPQCGGLGWSRWVDRIYADRLECCEKILRQGGLAATLILALIRQCQERIASSTPVFESSLASNSRFLDARAATNVRFGWIEGLVVWASTNHITFIGAEPLCGAGTTADQTIVDLAIAAGREPTEITKLQRACHEAEVYWASSFMSPSGAFHADHVPTSTYHRQFLVRMARMLISGLDLGAPVAGVHRGDVSVCDVGGQLRLVEISDTDGDVALVRILERYERQTEITAGVTARCRFADVWYDGLVKCVLGDGTIIFVSAADGEHVSLSGRAVRDLRCYRTTSFTLQDVFSRTTNFIVGSHDVLVPIFGLRRLPLVRPRVDGEFHHEPFQLAIDSLDDAGDVYLARRSIAAAQSLLPPAPRVAESDAAINAQLAQLGVASYDTSVASRFSEWSDLDALAARTPSASPSRQSLSIATDGSEAFGIGGAGAVLYDPVNAKLYCAACQVTSGPGTLSSYRTELFGLYLALIMTWTLRNRLPRLPLDVVLDNLGAVLAFRRLRERLPSTSQDVWDEIHYYARRLHAYYGLDVSWQRGHPERRKQQTEFTFLESMQHLSDGLAAVGRCGHGATDPASCFLHARRWFVRYAGRRLFDQTAAVLLDQIGQARLRGYNKFIPSTSPLDTWIRSMYCGRSKDVFSRAMTTKFILEQLATQERAADWHYPVADHRCRLCCVDGTHETLRHLLLDCSSPALCDIRRKYIVSMVAGVHLQNVTLSSFLRTHFQLDSFHRFRFWLAPQAGVDDAAAAGVDDEAAAVDAYGFVRGIWSPSLIHALYQFAPADVDSLDWFNRLVISFARAARTHLWRPVWNVWHTAAISSISTPAK